MHPRHQALFVVGAIEDADPAALWERNHGAPHEIMIELVRGRLLERIDLAALWIDAVEYVFDGAVLTGGIHALQDHEQRPAVLREQLFLEIGQSLVIGLDDLFGFVLVEPALLGCMVRFEVEFARAVDPERRDKAIQFDRERLRRFLGHDLKDGLRCVFSFSMTLPRIPLGRNMMNSTSSTP